MMKDIRYLQNFPGRGFYCLECIQKYLYNKKTIQELY